MKKYFLILFVSLLLLTGCNVAAKKVPINQSFHFIYINVDSSDFPMQENAPREVGNIAENLFINIYKTCFQASSFQFNPDGSFTQVNDSDGSARVSGIYRYDGKTLILYNKSKKTLIAFPGTLIYAVDGTKFTIQSVLDKKTASIIFRSDLPTTN